MSRSRPLLFCCYLLVGAATVLSAQAADWPSYQHDLQHTGRSGAVVNASQLIPSWEAPRGYGTPTIIGNTVYSTKTQGGYSGVADDGTTWATYVTAFDLATGAIKWSHSGNYVFSSNAAIGGGLAVLHGGSPASGTKSPPTPAAKQLVVLDAATGAERYKVPVPGDYHPGMMPLLVPNPADGTVMAYYVGGNTLVAVRLGPTSGSVLWTHTGPLFGNTIPTLVGDSIVVAAACRFYAYDPMTGARNDFHQGSCSGGGGTTVTYDSERQHIYVLETASAPENVYNSQQALTAFRYRSHGQIDFVWQRVGAGIGRGAVALGPTGNVYVADYGLLLELNPATGATLRSVSGEFQGTLAPAVTAGVLWVSSAEGESTIAYSLQTLQPLRTLTGGNPMNGRYYSPGAFADGYFVMSRGDIVFTPGFAVWVPSPTPLQPAGAQAKAKFNSDGYADINWQNSRTGERVMWFMRDGIFQSGIYLETIAPEWKIAGTADLNADGFGDYVWQNVQNGQRVIWFLRDGRYQSGMYLPTTLPEWEIAASADFNADGHGDFIWQNVRTGERTMTFLRNGKQQGGLGLQEMANLDTIAPEWRIAAAADFNDDGYADLVWQNINTGERVMWFLRGGRFQSGIHLQTIAPEWRIAGGADYNNDRHADFIWQNINTGERVMWFLRNGQYQSGIYMQTIDRDWDMAVH